MRKKAVSLIAVVLMLSFLVMPAVFAPQQAQAATGAWYLINTEFVKSLDDTSSTGPYKSNVMGGGYVLNNVLSEGQEGDIKITRNITYADGGLVNEVVHEVIWEAPPTFITANQKVQIPVEIKVIRAVGRSYYNGVNATFDIPGIPHGITAGAIRFIAAQHIPSSEYYPLEGTKTYLEATIPAGSVGDKKSIYLSLGEGYVYVYNYEWREQAPPATTPTTPTVPTTTNSAQAFDSGCRISWQPASNALGYRLFRSTSKGSLGESVTDFYITGTSYADVNVEPNTTYYYTVKPVLKEADPLNGVDEQLGNAIATFTVTTGDKIYEPGSFKHFIMLKLNSPYMTVDGAKQEVDPGKGTAPIIISGRTMVPIRAVVEAMGGTAKWDATAKKVTLIARSNTVEMWVGNKTIKVNGVSKQVDVPSVIKNGRTFVPLRFAAENLKSKVDWINSTQEAVIVYTEE